MEHEYWEEKLHGFIDKELEPADHLAVEQHIADCADCQANLAYFQAMKSRFRMHADSVEIPASVEERLVAMVSKPQNRFRKILSPAFGLALAAAVLIAVFLPRDSASDFLFQQGNLIGEIVCHDCTMAERSGLTKGILCNDGHRMGLLCDNGSVWRFAADDIGENYVSDVSMIYKRVRVKGSIMDGPHLIRIESLEPMGSRQASLY